MRDVVLKAMTSQDHKTRRLSFKETAEDNSVSARIEKNWGYQVKSITPVYQVPDLEQWIKEKIGSQRTSSLKHLSVYRNHTTKTGEDIFEYKAVGDLFVIHDEQIFAIEFSYFFSVTSVVLAVKKQGG